MRVTYLTNTNGALEMRVTYLTDTNGALEMNTTVAVRTLAKRLTRFDKV
jgi:hypothetical protein